MSAPKSGVEDAAEFRQAVRQGRYADAAKWLASSDFKGSPQAALDLLAWARRLVLSQRAAAAAQLAETRSPRYGAPPPRELHTWELEG